MADPSEPELRPVRMDDGLLRCPHCDSYELGVEQGDVLVCDDCGERCTRSEDQCPRCGERSVTKQEVIGMRAPGQAPSQAPRRIVKRCDSCGWTNA